MGYVGLLYCILAGYSVVSFIKPSFNFIGKIGLGYIIGIGVLSFFYFILNCVGVQINLLSSLFILTLMIGIPLVLRINKIKETFIPTFNFPSIGRIHFATVLVVVCGIYLLHGNYKKGAYWPVAEYDSVTGYDFMGKVVAAEGKFNNTCVEDKLAYRRHNRFYYPPITAGANAFGFLIGFSNTHIIHWMYLIAISFVLFSFINVYVSQFAATLGAVFCLATPEMFSHGALSLTNLPAAAYISTSLISLYLWLDKEEKGYLLLSILLMSLGMIARTDAIAFALGGVSILGLDALRSKKNYLLPVVYGAICLGVSFSWSLFVRIVMEANVESLFVKSITWEPEKFNLILSYMDDYLIKPSHLYGITFVVFWLMIVINFDQFKNKKMYLFYATFISWLVYTTIYYFLDYIAIGDTHISFMNASYKRGVFCFVPIAWFFIVTNPRMEWVWTKLNETLHLNPTE